MLSEAGGYVEDGLRCLYEALHEFGWFASWRLVEGSMDRVLVGCCTPPRPREARAPGSVAV
jgi:hypothetical protein